MKDLTDKRHLLCPSFCPLSRHALEEQLLFKVDEPVNRFIDESNEALADTYKIHLQDQGLLQKVDNAMEEPFKQEIEG